MDSSEGINAGLDSVAEGLVRLLINRSLRLAAAESCTGGLIAEAITRVPGSSACFWGSFVSYTSPAKTKMLGVGEDTLNTYGAVSGETAKAMAMGALERSGADAAVSITGLAGPDGDGSGIPVGTVWIASARKEKTENELAKPTAIVYAKKYNFSGSRNEVRTMAAREALMQITELFTEQE
jgi:PncC family amidohydrolase